MQKTDLFSLSPPEPLPCLGTEEAAESSVDFWPVNLFFCVNSWLTGKGCLFSFLLEEK